MEILFLGGIFDISHQEEIINKTKTYVEYSANNFQHKIIKGLISLNYNVEIISAPFLGAYPMAYKDWHFKGFENNLNDTSGYKYVNFINVWGIRNLSRFFSLKNVVKKFAHTESDEKLIIIYSPHTPFIQAANYAKKIDKRIKTCLIVPDLPQYMNLSDKVSIFYKIFKSVDIKLFNRENRLTNYFVILTEQMKEVLKIENRKYVVIEGIYDDLINYRVNFNQENIKSIVYTGKLNYNFGVLNLVHAFMQIENKDLRLIICGSGEAGEDIKKLSSFDSRIEYKGQVSYETALEYTQKASVLVNPRQNDTNYTKYSFPSKIIDYLSVGKPVVAYMLDGMPEIYKNFLYIVVGNSINDLSKKIIEALSDSNENKTKKIESAIEYLRKFRTSENIVKIIIDTCK